MFNAKISALDVVVMVVYLVAIVGWGLFHSKRKNAEDYFLGGRGMPWFVFEYEYQGDSWFDVNPILDD